MASKPILRGDFFWRLQSRSLIATPKLRHLSTDPKPLEPDYRTMLSKPSWSVKSLFNSEDTTQSPPEISQKQLHHLLRLSALPLPTSEAEEAKMIKDLRSQLKFVQAIQKVDTEGVAPLQSIRDETQEAQTENEITVESLREDFEKEEVVGKRGRIRRKKTAPAAEKEVEAEGWDPLAQASRKLGRFFVVDTAKD